MKKLQKWSLGIIVFCVVLIIFISILPETGGQKAAKQEEAANLVRIEKEIKAITAYPDDEFIVISEIKDDGSVYQIWIRLKFVPENYQQVQTWTDAVCEQSRRILSNGGITRSVSVWAKHGTGTDEVVIYGRTFYSPQTGRSEFKNVKELNL